MVNEILHFQLFCKCEELSPHVPEKINKSLTDNFFKLKMY